MAEGEVIGDLFGPRRPPLTKIIKDILERYPDGGQILKELIQNADDAGATEVKFLYEHRSYGTDYLVFPQLTKFQGPALYAYNNAKFKAEDWEGIQNMMESWKKEDQLKVGRFGIGFNSVYHITDLPGIVSGDTVGFLDPHERYFGQGQPGQKYKVSVGLLGMRYKDQFSPFHNIYGCDLSQGKCYEGTLFRFPLRTEASELSEKKYTKEKISGLFEALRKEAPVILLFLNSVHSISVEERKENGETERLFQVEIAPESRNEVRQKRQELKQRALSPTMSEAKFIMNVQVSSSTETRNFKWLIVNQIGSTGQHVTESDESRITELSSKLHLLPWVGLAVPLNDEATNAGVGRLFCFLPLLADEDCKTGLPVHVHGYFGLTDNRRGIAWSGPDCQNSETAEWNQLLLTTIACSVYCKILEALVEDEPPTGVNEETRSQLVYSALPNFTEVHGHWCSLLKPLFQLLQDHKLFYAQSLINGNSWISLKEGVLDHLKVADTNTGSAVSPETRNAIISTVTQIFEVITNVPSHVLQMIADNHFQKHWQLTPHVVRWVIKNKNFDISKINRQEKLLLLGYVLSDGQISELAGLPLLPLANNEFINFHVHCHATNSSKSVFVPSGHCTAALLPNMEIRFLHEDLPDDTARKLSNVAVNNPNNQNPTQLVRLTDDIVLQNMRVSLPPEWFRGDETVQWIPGHSNHPRVLWLEKVWDWIFQTTSLRNSLKPLEGFPLVPLPPSSPNRSLGVLSPRSKFIFSSDGSGNHLPPMIISFLEACGCTVLPDDVPSYLRHHPSINNYIAAALPIGVLKVVNRCQLNVAQEHMMTKCSPNDRAEFRSFFCRLPDTVSASKRMILRQMPFFDTVDGTCTAIQVNGETRKAVSRDFDLPSSFKFAKGDKIISTSDDSTRKLLSIVKVNISTPADVLIQYLIPDVQTNSVYNAKETDLIMSWVLERMVLFCHQNKNFLQLLRNTSFVPTTSGQRKRAADLFDPRDLVLLNLFDGETERFPTGVFATDHMLSKLKELNLATRGALTENDLFKCAKTISTTSYDSSFKKANALVEIMNADCHRQTISKSLTSALDQIKWIPCAPKAPSNYPQIMPWQYSTAFSRSREICSSSKVFLIGSSMPTLGVEMKENIQKALGVTTDPSVRDVVRQLEIAVDSWERQREESPMALALFQNMLTEIYIFISNYSPSTIAKAIQDAKLKRWIWHGNGFASPTQVAFDNDFPADLRPHLFPLQNNFKKKPQLLKFFCQHGVGRTFSDKVILGVLEVIRDTHAQTCSEGFSARDVERDLETCCKILKWVVRSGKTLSESLQEKVFVPVQVHDGNVLVLEPCKTCTYCDQDWLRRQGVKIPDGYRLIHGSVPKEVAALLGVTRLTTSSLPAETLDFEFTPMGPYESITTRLKNILKEYKEGVGIFKELIQNADDACATKVKFLVDWRHGPIEKLVSVGMDDCQGPALWAYNDATFEDEDFKNITKLAGATKLEDLGKIGRFGLGFNAVYHLTDVPSFVSRTQMVIFDPNENHLQGLISNSRPGISINLAADLDPLTTYEDQFQPFHDVFGCKTKGSGQFFYDATQFRFPFRTSHGAKESNICKSVYDEEKVKSIVSSLRKRTSLLLLFTQHVNQVELYELKESGDPAKMELVLSVTKSDSQIIRGKTSEDSIPFIQECSNWWQKKLISSTIPPTTSPSRCELVTIDIKEMVSGLIASTREYVNEEVWLLTSCAGTDSSLRMASSEKGQERGFLPCAGAAVQLKTRQPETPDNSLELSVATELSGEAFCFLPLSIATGLPVHVNGYFAVMSNRGEIWKRSTSEDQPIEVQWNECLMEDALANSYIQLLVVLKSFTGTVLLKQYDFHTLWPRYDKVDLKTWRVLVKSVYSKLVGNELELFCSDGKWMNIYSGYVLSETLIQLRELVVEILKHIDQRVFLLPPEVSRSLEKSGHSKVLLERTIALVDFLQKFLFPNMSKIPPAKRDAVVCFGLDRVWDETHLQELFVENRCVTVSNDGHLAKPCELIHPRGAAANLFSAEDRRFPVGEDFLTENRLYVLNKLGMVKDQLSWYEICRRAKSVEKLEFEKGKERARNLIKYLNEQLEKLVKQNSKIVTVLRSTKFLPIMSEAPDGYFLPWKGCLLKRTFVAPIDIFLPSDVTLVGSSCLIVDSSNDSGCGYLSPTVKVLLGFSNRRPGMELVTQQLDAAIVAWSKLSDQNKQLQKQMVESVCKRIYAYFDSLVLHGKKQMNSESVKHLLKKLSKKDWLYTQGRFVASQNVAKNWNGIGAPFLYGLPEEYSRDYRNLLSAAGVKESFNETDFIDVLYALQEYKKGLSLSEEEMKLTVSFVNELKDVEKQIIKKHVGKIPLPDTNKVLQPSENLTVNLTFWLQDREDNPKVHEEIPQQRAVALGARTLQSNILKRYSKTIGTSFGQQEKLTDRLKNILEGYPSESILKELVQNADDAGASHVHFIYDTRVLPSERVVQNHADEIQGPALCVYNDRPFSDKDLEGIQKLGIGNKRDNPEMTGRYGIGFSAVYHLTDCPSFLSNDDTLVFLDPHCRYAPEATNDSPGEKFSPIDDKFRESFPDLLLGYLGNYFPLKGSTMFRLPLRTSLCSQRSQISNNCITRYDVEKLLAVFQQEAKRSLLFLNHIKKITLSRISQDDKIRQIYEVTSTIDKKHEQLPKEISLKVKAYKDTPTSEIPWEGRTYPLTVSVYEGVVEKWLVHQCCGTLVKGQRKNDTIPDGRKYGLFPRGGIAALVSSSDPLTAHNARRYVAYCFLPLPEMYTYLPVHVNGHFALDPARRGLWTDTDDEEPRTKWNNFIKSRVLPPGYAALIQEAQNYIPRCFGLSWYHHLFPITRRDTPWKHLTTELYRFLRMTKAPVLPLVVVDETDKTMSSQRIHSWLPVDEGYFVKNSEIPEKLPQMLLRIGLPALVHSPLEIYFSLQEAKVTSLLVSPKSVIEFLLTYGSKNSPCQIGKLPRKLEDTELRSIPDLKELMRYCKTEKSFGSVLEGLPLLLTEDGQLRIFNHRKPVYRSPFGDLFPNQSDLFVHSTIVSELSNVTSSDQEGVPLVMRNFTVQDLGQLLVNVFHPNLKGKTTHVPWLFPSEGVLSVEWFRRLWKFLQYYAKPEQNEKQVSLQSLGEWPVIPTRCGKLVTINSAKTVLDLTESGTEIAMQKKVRAFLQNVKCPTINNDITSGVSSDRGSTSRSTHVSWSRKKNPPTVDTINTDNKVPMNSSRDLGRKMAVTDPYVAHPHHVSDVLQVLDYMWKTDGLDVSTLRCEEIRDFLLFVQGDHENLERKTYYNKILKNLPLHKTLDGTHVSLSAFSSYALVPSGVPQTEFEKLQRHTKCLFLNSDVLPALEKLYKELGTGAGRTVSQFYIEYILPNFHIFSKESQMKYLDHVKDEVYPNFHQRSIEKQELLRVLKETRCLPDENGNLHYAKEFYDSNHKVFKVMRTYIPDQFPPPPFNESSWQDFLVEIGLQNNVSKELFLAFCEIVAEVANESASDPSNIKRSRVLVEHLFENHLHGPEFLSAVSTIKFIASEKVDAELSTIHKQYQCIGNGHPPFLQFRDSVTWHYRSMVWTSAPFLPHWVEEHGQIYKSLRVLKEPTYSTVVTNLQNISLALFQTYGNETLPQTVQSIIITIYSFLAKRMQECNRKEATDECTEICKDIGRRLKTVPCILIEEGRVLVKGEQLSYNLPDNDPLSPFLYKVPREVANFEHFLKRLGATEMIKLSQLANVFKAMKDQCNGEQLSGDYERKAKCAMHMFFELASANTRKVELLDELYLPSEDKYLVKSNQLVCKVPPRLSEVMKQLNCQILLKMEKCQLKRIPENDYIDALQEDLRPVKLESLVREEIDPACKTSTCSNAADGLICDFERKYTILLRSQEFLEGVKRLLRHQNTSNLSHEDDKRLEILGSAKVQIKCIGMESVKIQLVDRETQTILKDASLQDICYAVKEECSSWSLYMQHEFGGMRTLGILSKCVNKILDFCVQEKYLAELADMLSCDSPSQIAQVLNNHNITEAISETDLEFILPDDGWVTEREDDFTVYNGGTGLRPSGGTGPGPSRGNGGTGCGGGSGYIRRQPICDEDQDVFFPPDRDEARRWIRQSNSDLNAAECLLSSSPPFNALACFLSHQIAEKSLKAAMYAGCGISSNQLNTHDVHQLANDVNQGTEITGQVVNLADRVKNYYLSTRYPNRQPRGRVPADQFDENQAKMAVEVTSELLGIVETYVDECEDE